MESILAKIGEFSGAVGDFRNKAAQAIKEIAIAKESLNLLKIELDTKAQDLVIRETAVAQIESLVSLKADAEAALKVAEQGMLELKNARVAFDESVTKQKAELSEISLQCKKEQELITKEHAALDAREIKMKDDESKLLERLVAKIKEVK